jgi:hypothetical protein
MNRTVRTNVKVKLEGPAPSGSARQTRICDGSPSGSKRGAFTGELNTRFSLLRRSRSRETLQFYFRADNGSTPFLTPPFVPSADQDV